MLRHVLQLGLRAIQETFSLQAARANGYFTLVHIIASTLQVFLQPQQHVDTCTLVLLHNVVQHVVSRIEEGHGAYGKEHDKVIVTNARPYGLPQQVAYQEHNEHQLHPHHIEGHYIDRDEDSQQRNANAIERYLQEKLTVLAIYIDQACRKQLNHQQYREASYRRRCT